MRGLLLLLGLAVAAGLVLHLRSGSDDLSPPSARVAPRGSSEASLTLVGMPPAAPVPPTASVTAPESDGPSETDDEPSGTHAGGPPPDPPQVGPCRLALTLVDDTERAAPVETEVALWRLAAPGNADWTAGDQRQHAGRSAANGALVFDGLPEGRYRLFVRGVRDGADDPPAFEVSGPESQQRVVLRMPRTFRVRVRLVDAQGLPVRQANLRWDGARARSTQMDNPDWQVARRLHGATEPLADFSGGSGTVTASSRDRTSALTSHEGLYDLGSDHSEAWRMSVHSRSCTLEGADGGRASVEVVAPDRGPEGDRTYLGVLVPIAELAVRVVLPDGRRAVDAGARVHGSCQSMRVLPDTPHDAWRRVPFEVLVTLDGYHPLAFVTDLDGPPPRWTMKVEGETSTGPDPGLLTSRRGEEALPSAPAPR